MRKAALQQAKSLCASHNSLFLSTLSNNRKDFPFASVAQYLYGADNHFYLFISDIAQHSKNLAKHPQLSFMILNQQQQDDAENPRVTVMANAEKLTRDSSQTLISEFVEQHPKAAQYAELADFHIWRLTVQRVRYIGGFGQAFWLEKQQWYE